MLDKNTLITALIATLFTLIALGPVGYSAWKNQAPRIAAVDIQKIVDENQQELIQALTSNEQESPETHARLQRQTEHFAKKLSESVDALSATCRCVVVNKAAILGGSYIDFTDYVRERLNPTALKEMNR